MARHNPSPFVFRVLAVLVIALPTLSACVYSAATLPTVQPTPLPTLPILSTIPPTVGNVLAMETDSNQAQVTASRSLYIRAAATVHSRVIDHLWVGDVVEILGCQNGWAKIDQGWVNADYLSEDVCQPLQSTKHWR